MGDGKRLLFWLVDSQTSQRGGPKKEVIHGSKQTKGDTMGLKEVEERVLKVGRVQGEESTKLMTFRWNAESPSFYSDC